MLPLTDSQVGNLTPRFSKTDSLVGDLTPSGAPVLQRFIGPCVGHLHSNSWRANLFEVRPLIINSFFSLHFKAALMLFKVRSLLEVLGYI